MGVELFAVLIVTTQLGLISAVIANAIRRQMKQEEKETKETWLELENKNLYLIEVTTMNIK